MVSRRINAAIADRGVQASAAALVVLGAVSVVRALPWWMWAAWALVAAWAVLEAVQGE